MDNQFDSIEVFDGKNLSDIFKDIYDNQQTKKKQIKELVKSLTPLIEGIGDATLLVPLIAEYMELDIKNDEQLVKLAQIIQRIDSGKKSGGSEFDFNSLGLDNLLTENENIQKEVDSAKADQQEDLKTIHKEDSNE